MNLITSSKILGLTDLAENIPISLMESQPLQINYLKEFSFKINKSLGPNEVSFNITKRFGEFWGH